MKHLKVFENYNKMVVYFAHPTSTYYSNLEEKCIKVLEDNLDCIVLNPASFELQEEFKEFRKNNPDNYMVYFKELVARCDDLAYISFPPDWKVGAGIVYEAIEMVELGGKLYELSIKDFTIKEVSIDYVKNNKLSVEDTRKRLRRKMDLFTKYENNYEKL